MVIKEEKQFIEDLEGTLRKFLEEISTGKGVYRGEICENDSLVKFLNQYMQYGFRKEDLETAIYLIKVYESQPMLKGLNKETYFYNAAAYFCLHGLTSMYLVEVLRRSLKYKNSVIELFEEDSFGKKDRGDKVASGFLEDVVKKFNDFSTTVQGLSERSEVDFEKFLQEQVGGLLEVTKNRQGIDEKYNKVIDRVREILEDCNYIDTPVKFKIQSSENTEFNEAIKNCIEAVNKLIEYGSARKNCKKSLNDFVKQVRATVFGSKLSFDQILKEFDEHIGQLLNEINGFKDKLVIKEEKQFIEDVKTALSSFSGKKDVFKGAVYQEDSLVKFLKKYIKVEFTSANLVGFWSQRNSNRVYELKNLTDKTSFYYVAAHFCSHGLMNMYFSKVPFMAKKYGTRRDFLGKGGMGKAYVVEKTKRDNSTETVVMKKFGTEIARYIGFRASDKINEVTMKNHEQMKQIKKDNPDTYKEDERYKELKGKSNRIAKTKVVDDGLVSRFAEGGDLPNFFVKYYPKSIKDRLGQGIDEKEIIKNIRKCFKNITDDMITAVNQFHELNMVHCDIKPSNFLVYKSKDKEYKCKLADHDLTVALDDKNKDEMIASWENGTRAFKPDFIRGMHLSDEEKESVRIDKVVDISKKLDCYALWKSFVLKGGYGICDIISNYWGPRYWKLDKDIVNAAFEVCKQKADKIAEDNDNFQMFENIDKFKIFLGLSDQTHKEETDQAQGRKRKRTDKQKADQPTMSEETDQAQGRKRKRTDKQKADQPTMSEETDQAQGRKRKRTKNEKK